MDIVGRRILLLLEVLLRVVLLINGRGVLLTLNFL